MPLYQCSPLTSSTRPAIRVRGACSRRSRHGLHTMRPDCREPLKPAGRSESTAQHGRGLGGLLPTLSCVCLVVAPLALSPSLRTGRMRGWQCCFTERDLTPKKKKRKNPRLVFELVCRKNLAPERHFKNVVEIIKSSSYGWSDPATGTFLHQVACAASTLTCPAEVQKGKRKLYLFKWQGK
jgi:hypothetical protein